MGGAGNRKGQRRKTKRPDALLLFFVIVGTKKLSNGHAQITADLLVVCDVEVG